MSLEVDMPAQDDLAGSSNYLREEGTFHFQVTHVDEQPTSKGDKPIDGFSVELSVLGGPEAGKKTDLVFFNPKLNAADGGKWARAKQGAFLIAAGLVDESKCGQRISVNLADAMDHQLVATLQYGEDEHGQKKKYLELAYANIYHVDDPRAVKCEFNKQALGLIPKALRRDPKSFKTTKSTVSKGDDSNGAAGVGAKQPPKSPVDSASAAVGDDLGDM